MTIIEQVVCMPAARERGCAPRTQALAEAAVHQVYARYAEQARLAQEAPAPAEANAFGRAAACRTIRRLVPGAPTLLARDAAEWTDTLPAGTTAIYRCETAGNPAAPDAPTPSSASANAAPSLAAPPAG